jgi:aldose 1-epimerase
MVAGASATGGTFDVIELTVGELSLGIVPEIGGSLAYLRHSGIDLMRPLSEAHLRSGNVLGVAMFPMVPYANRIAGNAFEFGGKTWRFEPNNPPERFNVHGTGWRSPWSAHRSADGVLLSLDHSKADEPYSYRATQSFVLTASGLRVTLALGNIGAVTMPFGFGLHPWFIRDPDVELAFKASHFFMEGPEGVATERLATPPELDFSRSRALPTSWRNNDYGGWDGRAEIRFPSRRLGLIIEADPVFGHLMFYADPAQPYFCVEPQSNAPCAFNRSGAAEAMGTIVLAPGETVNGKIGFLPFSL